MGTTSVKWNFTKFLENRAAIAAGAMASAIAMVHLEQWLYTWTLRRVVIATTFEI